MGGNAPEEQPFRLTQKEKWSKEKKVSQVLK
jgi:hypothetical protein